MKPPLAFRSDGLYSTFLTPRRPDRAISRLNNVLVWRSLEILADLDEVGDALRLRT
jgi:hypothetical protein